MAELAVKILEQKERQCRWTNDVVKLFRTSVFV